MANYQKTASPNFMRRDDGVDIPVGVPDNRDSADLQAWLDAGNTPAPIPLDVAQAAQIAKIQQACEAAIFAGFTSSALGAAHTYPAKNRDQQNLAASVLASLMPGLAAGWTTPFWCEDASGNWAYVDHTAAQIQQVGTDGKAAVLANLSKCQTLIAQINAPGATVASVQAVTW